MKASLSSTLITLAAMLAVMSSTTSAGKTYSCRSPSRARGHRHKSNSTIPAGSGQLAAVTSIRKVSSKHRPKSTASAAAAAQTSSGNSTAGTNSTSTGSLKLMQIKGSGATLKVSKVSGPNGANSFINRGLSMTDKSSPWNPPKITIDRIVRANLDDFADTTFKNCKPYISLFKSAAKTYNLDPIMIASFAMEESSCDPSSSGDAGAAFGLMQLVGANCDGAPNGNCADNVFNVNQGAHYFRQQLDSFNGDFLQALGSYNGWQKGLTYAQATAAANTGCCQCQQNLDYLYQHLNGWYLGNSGDGLAVFNNLATCGNRP